MHKMLSTEIKKELTFLNKNDNDIEEIIFYPKYFNSVQNFYFRSFDVLFSLLSLIILSPIFVITSLMVLLSDGFPILFKQDRLGQNGRRFKIYKFRSMRKDAEEILKEDRELYQLYLENDYKLPPSEDPRFIKFGNFLRKSSLDELPQLINVLRGDMSIVGPRPIVPNEIERYDGYERVFLSVKPGITGLWQVTGRSEINYPDRMYLDLIYVNRKSFINDIKIVLRTITTVIKRVGAH